MPSERKHALLSASGASRWLACTPSARLEEHEPESSSAYADEGTIAHEYAEALLSGCAHLPEVSTEMHEAVSVYVTAVSAPGDLFSEVEAKVDFSHIVPGGFGTCDHLSLRGTTLVVTDLKYGVGVKVSSDTPQLKLYALGALRKYGLIHSIECIEMRIVQPRIGHTESCHMTTENLLTWAESIREKAQRAHKGEGTQVIGDHCWFCKVKHKCKAQNQTALALFANDLTVQDDQVLEVYSKITTLRNYLSAVEDHVYNTALAGKEWRGYKVVAGRSSRTIPEAKQKELYDHLRSIGYHKGDVIVQKIKGIGELEKMMGKTTFASEVEPFLTKPEGKPTLVLESDPRTALDMNPLKKFEK